MKGCGRKECGASSGFSEELTFGSGELDDWGYWEFPCRLCAESFERSNPDMAKKYGVWPKAKKEG